MHVSEGTRVSFAIRQETHNNNAMSNNGATTEGYPTPDSAPDGVTVRGFRIECRKMPILKSKPIEDMTSKLGIAPPEMIFGDNMVSIQHLNSGWGIEFNAFDALDRVDKTGASMLKVAHSREWQKSRQVTQVLFAA